MLQNIGHIWAYFNTYADKGICFQKTEYKPHGDCVSLSICIYLGIYMYKTVKCN